MTDTDYATDEQVDALLTTVQPPWASECHWDRSGDVFWNHDINLLRPDGSKLNLTVTRVDLLAVDGRSLDEIGNAKVWMLTPGSEIEDSPDFVEILGRTLVHLAQLARVGER